MPENVDNMIDDDAETPEAPADFNAQGQVRSLDQPAVGVLVDRDQDGISASSLDVALGQIDTKKLSAQVILQLASSWARETNKNYSNIGNENLKLTSDLTKAREENATLKGKNEEREKHAPLVTASLMSGPIVIGLGLDQLKSENWGVAIAAISLGIIITYAALLTRRGDSQ